jgi:putative transposase
MDDKYIHEHQSVNPILSHILFCPKRRQKVLVGPVHDRLQQIIEQVVELAIQPDHVPLFIQTNPSTLPTDIVRLIKGRSSHQVREEFAHLARLPSLWTRSTFSSTAGFGSQETTQHSGERQRKQE